MKNVKDLWNIKTGVALDYSLMGCAEYFCGCSAKHLQEDFRLIFQTFAVKVEFIFIIFT
jgi:hypothetical protein